MEVCEQVLAVDPLKRAPFNWFRVSEGNAHSATSRWKHGGSRHSQTGYCSGNTGAVDSPGVQPTPSPLLDKSLSTAYHKCFPSLTKSTREDRLGVGGESTCEVPNPLIQFN
jgi:hypothetical protein